MYPRTPRSTRTGTAFPDTTVCRAGRAARGQRGGERPASQCQGRVPRGNDGDHALGFVLGVGKDAFLVGWNDSTLHFVSQAGVVVVVVADVAEDRKSTRLNSSH